MVCKSSLLLASTHLSSFHPHNSRIYNLIFYDEAPHVFTHKNRNSLFPLQTPLRPPFMPLIFFHLNSPLSSLAQPAFSYPINLSILSHLFESLHSRTFRHHSLRLFGACLAHLAPNLPV